MQPDVVKRFETLWESSDLPPDVFTFVQQFTPSSNAQLLAILLQDQRYRWRTDAPLKVEDYLAVFSELADDQNCVLELAVGEFRARQYSSPPPKIAEFASRFARVSDSLRAKLSALASASDKTMASDQSFDALTDDRQSRLSITFLSESTSGKTVGGRYRAERVLGQGGFGRVYLAFDKELRRQVAVKVPTSQRFKDHKNAEIYLEEARTVAGLDHPNIVPVYDMGRTDDGSIYVVSKYIEGCTLRARVIDKRPSYVEAATLLATIARGLHHAHEKRIIHRDVKPANILIEESTNKPYIADFGLAIREEDYLQEDRIVGTPAYMSPEQARGEGHRLDGRSDVYALGVVLYELLVGKRPFRGSTSNELMHQVVSVEPASPRTIDESIPGELERICLKALAKRATDRYATAELFAADLMSWQQEPVRELKDLQITPKGLRSFDAEDADFFLDLLPGPRSRDGLPEDIRFWKVRIEESDPEKTFSVGLIYGPSGCGKSSLVKAGLIPRLSAGVTAIYLEATPEDTETRILRQLRKHVTAIPNGLGLVETFGWLRRNLDRKVVIVLDQFEQWLHAHRAEQESELVRSLRQCDGGKLQAVVMVRDDFSMAASRFMRELETQILEGHNFATVDLFDIAHARKVLTKFGQAFGKLPANEGNMTEKEQDFVRDVASGLAEDGKVVSVRLALFAEMIKGKSWVTETLDDVGGTEGVGENFLEEMFGSRDANPEHLHHQAAARQVLMTLLPEVGSDIKGHMRSHAELLQAAGYQDRPREFNDLLRILDGKLRLITPTDPQGVDTESTSDRNSQFYQLTHDYLVPSLRDWLTRKQKESPRGRAELKLTERSAVWNAKPENRHLPSAWEWSRINALTDNRNWTEPQSKMMDIALRVHGIRLMMFLGIASVLVLIGLQLRQRMIDFNNDQRATGFVTALTNAKIDQLPDILQELSQDRRWVDPKLNAELTKHPVESNERLNLSLALLPSDPSQIEYLKNRLLIARPEQVATIRGLLFQHREALTGELWQIAERAKSGEKTSLLQSASALAGFDPHNEAKWRGIADQVVDALVNENSLRVAIWTKSIEPARRHLIDGLGAVYRSDTASRTQSQINQATYILEEYAVDDVDKLAELLLDADSMQFVSLFDEFAAHGDRARSKLEAELDRTLGHDWNDEPLDQDWSAPAGDIVAELQAADGSVEERYAFCQTISLEDYLRVNENLRESGYRATRLRPYPHEGAICVAAAWTRDGKESRVVTDVSAELIAVEDENQRELGFTAVDVAGYISGESEQFAAIWTKQQDRELASRLFAGVLHADVADVQDSLMQNEFEFTQALQGFRGLKKQRKYCGVVLNTSTDSTTFLSLPAKSFDEMNYLDKIAWDIDPGHASRVPNSRARNLTALLAADQVLINESDNVAAHLSRGKCRFYLGKDVVALEDFDFVFSQLRKRNAASAQKQTVRQAAALLEMSLEAYRYRAMLYARIGNPDKSRQDVSNLAQLTTSVSDVPCLDVVVAAHLDDDANAMRRFEQFIDDNRDNGSSLYDAARAYSIISGIYQETEIARSKVYAERSVLLLKQAVVQGYNNFTAMQFDAGLEPILENKEFVGILEDHNANLRYAAVWNNSTTLESRNLQGLSPTDHLSACHQLQAEGYRIASIGTTSGSGRLVCASVWHRPIIQDTDRESLARRKANAAIASFRMSNDDRVWSLLNDDSDPRLRSWIIHRLAPMAVPLESISLRLGEEAKPSIRRALILAMGEYNLEEQNDASKLDRETLINTLLGLYRKDSDPGVHAAAEWILARWLNSTELDQIELSRTRKATAADKNENTPGWFLTEQGHTMVVVPGPVQFRMGSHFTQQDRSVLEYLHRVQLNHSFAIASKEISVQQFERFLQSTPEIVHSYTEIHSPDPACPQISVTWYEAAAYCRWLSEQENVSEDQMCFPEIVDIKEGMILPPDYLSRTGYRLPTEAEWEYACRAGTDSSRYYGDADQLLGKYAWYSETSDDRTWPVGSLKPNDLGLFDMHGNVQEWCQEKYSDYNKLLGSVSGVHEDTDPVSNAQRRLLRGGSFGVRSSAVRSADRSFNRPSNRYNNSGFRPARTYNQSP